MYQIGSAVVLRKPSPLGSLSVWMVTPIMLKQPPAPPHRPHPVHAGPGHTAQVHRRSRSPSSSVMVRYRISPTHSVPNLPCRVELFSPRFGWWLLPRSPCDRSGKCWRRTSSMQKKGKINKLTAKWRTYLQLHVGMGGWHRAKKKYLELYLHEDAPRWPRYLQV